MKMRKYRECRKNHAAILIHLSFVVALSLCISGCAKAENGNSNQNLGHVTDADKKIAIENNTADIVGNESIEVIKEDLDVNTAYDGEKFYDQGPMEVVQLDNSCMMQPVLSNPEANSVVVYWFTEDAGESSEVLLYEKDGQEESDKEPTRVIEAETKILRRIRGGRTEDTAFDPSIKCDVYKHTAVVDNLPLYHGNLSERVEYQVRTDDKLSPAYTLAAAPQPGTPLKILLTSDHQVKNMVAANIQKVYETVGNVDAVWMNGDTVDVVDSGYHWFFRDNAFFRVMTGTANDDINGQMYYGAPLLQQAPIYSAIGNHDVSGVYSDTKPLNDQFNNPSTREAATRKWEALLAKGEVDESERDRFIEDNSYNTITYEEIFELPTAPDGSEKYYAVTIGDIRLVALDVARVWRLANIGLAGKYSEIPGSTEDTYGYGDFIFEPVDENSDQIKFLKSEVASASYKDAKYKVVMFHQDSHSLGVNSGPSFTDPVASTATSPITGQNMTIYNYPLEKDYVIDVIEPVLEASGTNLLFEAHSHLWNRFRTASGMNILETSNVGNSYGAYTVDNQQVRWDTVPSALNPKDQYSSIGSNWNADDYLISGDPFGLEAIVPSENNLDDNNPYISSNTLTVFSILDTAKGTVDSYYFDTEKPDSEVILFDSFPISE